MPLAQRCAPVPLFFNHEFFPPDRVYVVHVLRDNSEEYHVQGIHKTLEHAEYRAAKLKTYDWVTDAYVVDTFLYD